MPDPKKLGTISLAAVIFFTVSGGPYGMEPLLYYCNGKGALLLLTLVPLLWDIPIILTVLELNGLMHVTGGYYQWVKQALGLRWAFYEGWWSWLCNFVDLAIYPQLVIMYAGLFFPGIEAYRIPLCLCFVWAGALLNIRGIVSVGRTSLVMGTFVIAPFILVIAYGLSRFPVTHGFTAMNFSDHSSYIGMAIFTVIWNFIGWDNVTTYAGEVKRPTTAYLRAICAAFALVFVIYYGTVLLAENSGIDLGVLKDKGFPELGMLTGGHWLAVFIALGGVLSSTGLFLAILLSISRIPEVMAADKMLPAPLCRLHRKYNTPYISIITVACVVSGMVLWKFGELLVIDVTLYFAGLLLEFISLVVMRRKAADAVRPFRVPLGVTGLCVMLALPCIVYFTGLIDIIRKSEEGGKPMLFAVGMLVSADVVWRAVDFMRKRRMKNA